MRTTIYIPDDLSEMVKEDAWERRMSVSSHLVDLAILWNTKYKLTGLENSFDQGKFNARKMAERKQGKASDKGDVREFDDSIPEVSEKPKKVIKTVEDIPKELKKPKQTQAWKKANPGAICDGCGLQNRYCAKLPECGGGK